MSLTPTADAVRICLFGIMMVNISAIQMYMGPVRALRPGMTFLALALLLVILKPKLVDWKNMTAAYPSKWVIVFFGLACGSALFGLSLGGSGSYILNVYSRNLIFFFLIVIAIRNIHDLALADVVLCGQRRGAGRPGPDGPRDGGHARGFGAARGWSGTVRRE